MTPRQYEEGVARHFQKRGYLVKTTPYSSDFGVDVFAERAGEKIAIQAKMFGGTKRPVNGEMVLQLHGAKDYFDCTKAVLVTDGRFTAGATKIANKLQIDILQLPAAQLSDVHEDEMIEGSRNHFDAIWEQHVMPLAGKTIGRSSGLTNKILSVDWAGVERLTSSNRMQRISIEIFRKAINHIIKHGSITRSHINEEYAKRASSGVVLILSQVPIFEYVAKPQGIKLRASAPSPIE
jgi:restriction system protein